MEEEGYHLKNDVRLLCRKARSFPEGVLDAHRELHALVKSDEKCGYYGLSRPEGDAGIVYYAAVTTLDGDEDNIPGTELVTVKMGSYVSVTVHDYMRDTEAMGKAFGELIGKPGLDPEGYCVEWYLSDKDVKCMIRLED